MTRQEHDREDILREATALVERVELLMPGNDEPIVVGCRRDGSFSFYFGSEFVLQFNTRHELRRAYWQGRLVKADRGELFFMDRERSDTAVVLKTSKVQPAEEADFRRLVQQQLGGLAAAIQSQTVRVLRQIPSDSEIVARVARWLDKQTGLVVAQKPNAG